MSRITNCVVLALATASLSACGSNDSGKEAAKLDDTLLGKGNEADPVLTAALEDQIMVDPKLTGQANKHAAKAPDQPTQSPIPPEALGGPAPAQPTTLGQRVAAVAPQAGATTAKAGATSAAPPPAGVPKVAAIPAAPVAPRVAVSGDASMTMRSFDGCGVSQESLRYSLAWSARMPGELPLYPQARVSEAAGSDSGGCRLRAVTFATTAAPRNLIDYYLNVARKAGYDAKIANNAGEQMVMGQRSDGAAFYVVITARDSGGTIADIVSNRGV